MRSAKKIYHRTEVGDRALRRGGNCLTGEQRAVLSAIDEPVHFDALRARLPDYPKGRFMNLLRVLEADGFVEAITVQWLKDLLRLGYYEPPPVRQRSSAPASSS